MPGEVTLPEVFHLRHGLVVLLVVLMALGGFRGAEAVEKWSARRAACSGWAVPATRGITTTCRASAREAPWGGSR